MQPSDVKTLPAAAFALVFRVLELEGLIQALLDEINQSAVDQRQTQGIDHDFHAARFENRVFRMNFVRIIHDIGESRAAGLLDSDTQSDAGSALRQVRSNPISRRFRQQYRHTAPPSKLRPRVPAATLYITRRCPVRTEPELFFSYKLMLALHETNMGAPGRVLNAAPAPQNAAPTRQRRC